MDWVTQYSEALDARDAREHAHKSYIDAYTALADRTVATNEQPLPVQSPASPSASQSRGSKKDHASPAPADLLAALRADLTVTQKARSVLQTQLQDLTEELSALAAQQKASQSQIAALTKQKTDAERKLRDRDEELKGKDKLVERAHDEMIALELYTNMAQEKSETLKRENQQLVQRWMARMGEEAEKVNRESKWE